MPINSIFYLLNVYFLRHEPATPEELLQAFRTIDPEGHGYVTLEAISTLMTQDGEPFTQDELDEMLETALDPHTQTVPYEYYINQLMVGNTPVFRKIIPVFQIYKNILIVGKDCIKNFYKTYYLIKQN